MCPPAIIIILFSLRRMFSSPVGHYTARLGQSLLLALYLRTSSGNGICISPNSNLCNYHAQLCPPVLCCFCVEVLNPSSRFTFRVPESLGRKAPGGQCLSRMILVGFPCSSRFTQLSFQLNLVLCLKRFSEKCSVIRTIDFVLFSSSSVEQTAIL